MRDRRRKAQIGTYFSTFPVGSQIRHESNELLSVAPTGKRAPARQVRVGNAPSTVAAATFGKNSKNGLLTPAIQIWYTANVVVNVSVSAITSCIGNIPT